jgi:hypothetical protein
MVCETQTVDINFNHVETQNFASLHIRLFFQHQIDTHYGSENKYAQCIIGWNL